MLPRMDLLRKAELRPLDTFEASGVVRLRQGQTLVVSEEGLFRLRLLGAIRATAGCVDCHGCERGELLGAFSYVLRRQSVSFIHREDRETQLDAVKAGRQSAWQRNQRWVIGTPRRYTSCTSTGIVTPSLRCLAER